MEEIKREVYNNAEVFKIKNRRVRVISIAEKDEYLLEFMVLSNDLNPRALHKVYKDKLVYTGIKITEESALAVATGLLSRLMEDGKIEILVEGNQIDFKIKEKNQKS